MKKFWNIVGAVIICLLWFWIGFYFGKWNKITVDSEVIKPESNFDKQTQCMSYYDIYKDKLSMFYSENSKYSNVDSLSVSYSPKLDSCVVSYIIIWQFGDLNSDYEFHIEDVGKWDASLYKCSVNALEQNEKCWMESRKDKLYSLLY